MSFWIAAANISAIVENHEYQGRLDADDIDVIRISFSNDLLGEGGESEPFNVEKIGSLDFQEADLPLGVIISVSLLILFAAIFIVIAIRK